MSSDKPPTLKVADLFVKRNKRDSARLKAYNEILRLIYHKISKTSEIADHPSNIVYTVPPFILGLPKIDLEDCIVYLVHSLRHGGFNVRYTYPNLLSISWEHHEHTYLTKENPIIQAMVALKPQPPAAKRKGVSFSPQPALVEPVAFNPFGDSQKELAPARKPGNYQPPAAFLNSIERPLKQDPANALKLWY